MNFILKLPVNSKLETSFPNDPHFDVKINLQNKQYKLQKAYLRVESDYFHKLFEASPQSNSFTVNLKQDHKKQEQKQDQIDSLIFDKIMRCFYGGKYTLEINELYQAYHICYALEIDTMLKELNNKMLENLKDLNFFLVYSLAIKFDLTDLIEKSQQFLIENQFNLFRQEWILEIRPTSLKYPSTFLDLDETVIKAIFKFHNSKKKHFLSYIEQFDLLKQYCNHQYIDEDKEKWKEELQRLVQEIIDQSQLNSQEYKYIYHQELLFLDKNVSNNLSICGGNSFLIPQQQMQQCQVCNPIKKVILSENTLYQKEILELKNQNQCQTQEIDQLKIEIKNHINNVKQFKTFEEQVTQMLQNLQNESEEKESKSNAKIEQLEKSLIQLKEELKKMEIELQSKDAIIYKYQILLNQYQQNNNNGQNIQHQKVKTDQHFYQPYGQKSYINNITNNVSAQNQFDPNFNNNLNQQQLANQFDQSIINNNDTNQEMIKFQRAFSKDTIDSYFVIENDKKVTDSQIIFQSNIIQNCSLILNNDQKPENQFLDSAKQYTESNSIVNKQQLIDDNNGIQQIQNKLQNSIQSICFSNEQSKIIEHEDYLFVQELFQLNIFQKLKLSLSYRGSRDGFQSKIFKQKCLGLEHLLIIIKSWEYDQIFGGYISVKIQDYDDGYLSDENAFIFSITKKKKFLPKNTDCSLFFGEEIIISFGEDIKISNDCDQDDTCSSQFLQDYYDPNQNNKDQFNSSWLTGNQQFQVDDIEVFKVDIIQSMDI